MANQVPASPTLPIPPSFGDIKRLYTYLPDLGRTLYSVLAVFGQRANAVLPKDGTEDMTGPIVVKQYLKAALPSAVTWKAGVVYVSDETGGATLAFSDGTNWRRVQDRVIVS